MTECPSCSEPTIEGAKFCEACGSDINVPIEGAPAAVDAPACVSCGEHSVTVDGYCGSCGHKQPAERDHLEVELDGAAYVTDRGKRHHRNEDAGAIGVGERMVLVVCDGVSTTDNPDQASQLGADTARDALGAAPESDEAAMVAAVLAAQEQVTSVPAVPGGEGNPSCTIVAAAATPGESGVDVVLGWLGDSRGYWIDADGVVEQLTEDHSWANDQIRSGVDPAEAAADPQASTISRWLGLDNPDATPEVVTVNRSVGGRLMLCSDGLWNYARTDEEMSALVAAQSATTLVELAAALTAHAVASGGHDNITVALAQL